MYYIRKEAPKVGDIYLYSDDELGVEEECIVTEVHPLYAVMETICGCVLKSVLGINDSKFIRVVDVD